MKTGSPGIDRAFDTLEGTLKAIRVDGTINGKEMQELAVWCDEYEACLSVHPFTEVIPFIRKILKDGKLTEAEMEDLQWFIDQLRGGNAGGDRKAARLHTLEGIFHGILADDDINDREFGVIAKWLLDNKDLSGSKPYDDLATLLEGFMKDGAATDSGREKLKSFILRSIGKN